LAVKEDGQPVRQPIVNCSIATANKIKAVSLIIIVFFYDWTIIVYNILQQSMKPLFITIKKSNQKYL